MIVVHVPRTWPQVLAGEMSSEDAVLGRWPISQEKVEEYGDVVAGVCDNVVVAVFDIADDVRDPVDDKVSFKGEPSRTWAHLVGQPTPVKPWGRRGDAWPVRVIDTAVVSGGEVPVEETAGGRRAVVDDFTIIVDDQGDAIVLAPAGRTVTVRSVAHADHVVA